MRNHEAFHQRLMAQRAELVWLAARTEEDLLRLETDVEREPEERAQDENLIRLLDRLDTRQKAALEAIDRAQGVSRPEHMGSANNAASRSPMNDRRPCRRPRPASRALA